MSSEKDEGPDAVARQLGASGLLAVGAEHPDDAPLPLRIQYLDARRDLDESSALISRHMDLIELLGMGLLDADQARDLVDELKRDFLRWKRVRGILP
jgi:hypothetical protein